MTKLSMVDEEIANNPFYDDEIVESWKDIQGRSFDNQLSDFNNQQDDDYQTQKIQRMNSRIEQESQRELLRG